MEVQFAPLLGCAGQDWTLNYTALLESDGEGTRLDLEVWPSIIQALLEPALLEWGWSSNEFELSSSFACCHHKCRNFRWSSQGRGLFRYYVDLALLLTFGDIDLVHVFVSFLFFDSNFLDRWCSTSGLASALRFLLFTLSI